MLQIIHSQTFGIAFGVTTTMMAAIAGGTIHLTNMISEASIPRITAWAAFFNVLNSAILTAINASH